MSAPVRYYRCYRCQPPPAGFEFRATEMEAKVQCPACGAGHPAVLELVPVHFLFEDRKGLMVGQAGIRWKLACMPKRGVLNGLPASENPLAITCEQCRNSPAFFEALERFGIPRDNSGGFRLGDDLGGIKIFGPGGCCG